MIATLKGPEYVECPPEYQAYLTDTLGVNIFGDPLFRIVWGQNEILTYATPQGYQEMPKSGVECWVIEQWKGPWCFGTPSLYYSEMLDPETGTTFLGEYPEFGFYTPIIKLQAKRFLKDENRLEIKPLILELAFMERLADTLKKALAMTEEEAKLAMAAIEERKRQDQVLEITDRLADSHLEHWGPKSYTGQRNRNGFLAQRMEAIEREWIRQGFHLKKPPTGFFQKN